ncbi:MAG: PCRF domain-containing protein, partial [Planctomycetaceae bacterium]
MAGAGFWDDQEKAQELIGELRRLSLTIKPLSELSAEADDLGALLELADEAGSDEFDGELAATVNAVGRKLAAAELQATMSAPEDASDVFLTVQATARAMVEPGNG